MALLKSYTCRSCGGVLNFDEDQEIFACPFCGEEFNYTDFHREELLSQAVRCLKDLRFDAAKEKYNTLLSNNPQDFEALRGMVLVNGRINSQADLKSAEDLRDCDFAAAIKASEDAGQAVTGASESLYFERLTALLRLGEEYRDKTADALDKSEKAREKYRDAAEREKKSQNDLSLTGSSIGIGLAMGAGAVLGLIRFALEDKIRWLVPVAIIGYGVIALIVLAVFLIHRYKVRNILYKVAKPSEYLTSGHIIQDFLSEEAVAISRRYKEAYELLAKDDPAVNGYTPPPVQKKAQSDDPFIDIAKTVVCSKCGGQLKPDKEKGLFECRFCGVAYGASLFFNNPLEKANEALIKGDYVEADQRYSHILMVTPNDFDALLGRILCTGKWKNIDEINLTKNILPAVSKKLKDRTGEAVDHAVSEDRLFFVTLRDLADVIIENAQNEQALTRSENDLRAVEKKTVIHVTGNETSREWNEMRSEIRPKIDKLNNLKDELLIRFESLKTSLSNEMNRHSGRVSAS